LGRPTAKNASDPGDEAPPEVAPEPEKKKKQVVLKNPKWEAEKVGFNEETQVSVELELPEEHAHKTKVAFELFAKTPKGPERISQGEGKEDSGKAIGIVPVYIPVYKDEDGNRIRMAVRETKHAMPFSTPTSTDATAWNSRPRISTTSTSATRSSCQTANGKLWAPLIREAILLRGSSWAMSTQ